MSTATTGIPSIAVKMLAISVFLMILLSTSFVYDAEGGKINCAVPKDWLTQLGKHIGRSEFPSKPISGKDTVMLSTIPTIFIYKPYS